MIKVKDLNFSYPKNQIKTLHDLNFEVNKGEIFGLLGPSGAGKSTTQKILIGLLKQYQGSVQVLGQELAIINHDYYEKIGVSFELPNLYHKFTAEENLKYFQGMFQNQKTNLDALLESVGLLEDKNKRVSEFSKGMKMRLNFCRAFIHDPELLFLDEPTSGLDPGYARKIKDIILEKKKEGKTFLLTTHNMTLVEELCDRVAFIVDGRIALIDSPRDLIVNHGQRKLRVEYKENQQLKQQEFELANIGYNQQYVKLLQDKQIERIHTLEASLEEIFIQVTGRTLT